MRIVWHSSGRALVVEGLGSDLQKEMLDSGVIRDRHEAKTILLGVPHSQAVSMTSGRWTAAAHLAKIASRRCRLYNGGMKKPSEPSSIGVLQDAGAPLRRRPRKFRDPAQPQRLDPMPTRIEPCLATLVSKPPVGPQWAFEVKWDGYRLACSHRHARAEGKPWVVLST